MTDCKSKIRLLTACLKWGVVINVALVMCGCFLLCMASDKQGIYAAVICVLAALSSSIGLTLLWRNYSIGLAFVAFSLLLSAFSLGYNRLEWQVPAWNSVGFALPFVVNLSYFFFLLCFLFLWSEGRGIWQQMQGGLDYAHFRHIYQLSSVVAVAVIVTAFVVGPKRFSKDRNADSANESVGAVISLSRLDAVDVTLDEVLSIEKHYNDSLDVSSINPEILGRIFALKHILLSGLMSPGHNSDNLVNICKSHEGFFSEDQQAIIDWYLSLDVGQQRLWNECETVNTLSDFQEIIINKIEKP